jgi:elongation factor P--beta-lysine ligase
MELNLRSALASGLNSVYELGPCFRPGESDGLRHPEFYMMELFQRDLNFEGLIKLTTAMLDAALNRKLDIARVSVSQWLKKECDVDCSESNILIKEKLLNKKLVPEDFKSLPTFKAINYIIDQRLEPQLSNPTLLIDFPACTICLAKRVQGHPHLIERFELFVNGIEIAHGFVDETETTDLESRMRENGDEFVDLGVLELLKTGRLPQSAGVGFGIERIMLGFCGVSSISELIHKSQFVISNKDNSMSDPVALNN